MFRAGRDYSASAARRRSSSARSTSFALSSIALCASYLYATEGKVPRAFADAGLQHAFAARA